ncbi:MAG: beta-propeller domain-containing protein [Acidobacteria bacterium]|nr:beta-propeller domain-containing protein [Acidobacteriota bacterium]
MTALLDAVAAAQLAEQQRQEAARVSECRNWAAADNVVGIDCSAPLVETVTVASAAADAITNVQHEGVDEGGIVKRRGDLLIVLRRGRLFTIDIGVDDLRLVSVLDASGVATSDGHGGVWYDELLVWNDTVVVIGFNYGRGGTELGLFHLGSDGVLRYDATYHLRSSDYYSASNYASRLIGSRLILYTSRGLDARDAQENRWRPSLRRWHPDATSSEFHSIAPLDRVFQSAVPLELYPSVHTLVTCDLAERRLTCTASVFFAGPLDVHYVSPSAVYAWTSAAPAGRAILHRLPLDGGPVTAVSVRGSPASQLAFLEADRALNVVVSDDGNVSLLRLPIDAFGDGRQAAPESFYRHLASDGEPWPVVRHVGHTALVALTNGARTAGQIIVAPLDGRPLTTLDVGHGITRIEALGDDAVVVGAEQDALRLTTVRLGAAPRLATSLLLADGDEAERRSHGFFYRRDDAHSGVFGLPVVHETVGQWSRRASVRMVFVWSDDGRLTEVGALTAAVDATVDDDCQVSCVDWYGNARPIFIGDRVLALLGYELVEGQLFAGVVHEIRRLDFTPGSPKR